MVSSITNFERDPKQSSIHGNQEEARPEGVKKAKERLKAQRSAQEMEATSSKSVEKLQEMFEIRNQDHELKKQDFEMKEKLNNRMNDKTGGGKKVTSGRNSRRRRDVECV
ncbi:unnamed protein product [Brassica oleracea var. botrytis]|uniref:No apical meristem-associated C-terminal domain-containing protein n=1 Tax=Brassica oleracea TaxID=3712 RepID=A0A3P6FYA5_BRAOL|nr:unnamed protein product [Brassica oleracea]